MQIQRGKACEIWPRVVTLDGHRIDTWGLVFDRNNSCFAFTRLRRHERRTVLILSCECSGLDNTRKGWPGLIIQERASRFAPPAMCLPFVYLTPPHMTKSPRPSPSIFAYCKSAIKYWRRERPRNEAIVHEYSVIIFCVFKRASKL